MEMFNDGPMNKIAECWGGRHPWIALLFIPIILELCGLV